MYRLVVLCSDIMMIAQKNPSILSPQTLLHRKIWQCVYGRRGVLNQRVTSVSASVADMGSRDPLGVSGRLMGNARRAEQGGVG